MLSEKDIIDIKLENALLVIECNAKNSTDSDGIYQGTKSLMKINARLLVKAFSNKTSSMPCNRAVRILFDTKHPFVAHYILLRSWGSQSPGTIPDERILFFLHRLNQLGILESSSNSAKFSDGGETIFWVGFEDGIFRAGLHEMKVKWG